MAVCVNICESQIKKMFSFYWFFAKIYSLLTHVRKTPPLRSHYSTTSPPSSQTPIWDDIKQKKNHAGSTMVLNNMRLKLVWNLFLDQFLYNLGNHKNFWLLHTVWEKDCCVKCRDVRLIFFTIFQLKEPPINHPFWIFVIHRHPNFIAL